MVERIWNLRASAHRYRGHTFAPQPIFAKSAIRSLPLRSKMFPRWHEWRPYPPQRPGPRLNRWGEFRMMLNQLAVLEREYQAYYRSCPPEEPALPDFEDGGEDEF